LRTNRLAATLLLPGGELAAEFFAIGSRVGQNSRHYSQGGKNAGPNDAAQAPERLPAGNAHGHGLRQLVE
jgi:hypothetical protein